MVMTMEEIKYFVEYLEKYGDFSFSEKPFNEIDGLIFSQLTYIDFNGIVDKDSIFISDASIKYISMHSDEEIEKLIGISEKAVKLLILCAKTRRFGWCEICHYVNSISDEIDKQFSAINILLNKETNVIAFRGTDVTITGAKESAMLSYMFPVPAQIEALHYFQETAMLSGRNIITLGHSKGGCLATFAAVSCSNSLKKKIVRVIEYDAPGFPNWFFERYDYKQIKDKIQLYTPYGSIIGRLIGHDVTPIIVDSDESGIKQHQVSSWIINDDKFVLCDEYSYTSNFVSNYLNELAEYTDDDDLELFFNSIEQIADKIGLDDFYDMKAIDFQKAIELIDTITNIDEAQKERLKQILKKLSTEFAKEYFSSMAKDYSKRAKGFIEKFIPSNEQS